MELFILNNLLLTSGTCIILYELYIIKTLCTQIRNDYENILSIILKLQKSQKTINKRLSILKDQQDSIYTLITNMYKN